MVVHNERNPSKTMNHVQRCLLIKMWSCFIWRVLDEII